MPFAVDDIAATAGNEGFFPASDLPILEYLVRVLLQGLGAETDESSAIDMSRGAQKIAIAPPSGTPVYPEVTAEPQASNWSEFSSSAVSKVEVSTEPTEFGFVRLTQSISLKEFLGML